jgi:hypothetical protein
MVPPRVDTGDHLPVMLVRHMFLAKPQERLYRVCVATAMTISGPSSQRVPGAHPSSATIRHPPAWELEETDAAHWPATSASVGSVERKWRGQSSEAPCFAFALRRGWPQIGGPFIGAGINAEKELRFKLRAGFEMAAPSWLVYSLSADTDFRRAVIAPAVEAALPSYWYISWALGLGIPVRVYDTFDAGLRLQAAVHAPVVGVVVAVDLFPGLLRDVPSSVQYGVYGQLSF